MPNTTSAESKSTAPWAATGRRIAPAPQSGTAIAAGHFSLQFFSLSIFQLPGPSAPLRSPFRNSDSSRTLSLAILLIVYFQRSGSSGPFAIDLKRRDYPSPSAQARIHPYHVGATRPLRKVTGVMSLFSEGRGGNVRTGTQSTHPGNSGLSHKNAD